VIAAEPVGVAGSDGCVSHACCILIDPLAPHQLSAAPQADLFYLEPSRRTAPEAVALLAPIREATSVVVVRRLGAPSFWSDWLARGDARGVVDMRVDLAMGAVDAALPDPPALAAAAAASGLSVERFRHLFADDIGLTYGRYVLWGRLRLAAAELVAGRDATTAAHAAGFADAAHFARTLKSTFGVTASQTLLAPRRPV
jgi:AraC-like DNA-binding protein